MDFPVIAVLAATLTIATPLVFGALPPCEKWVAHRAPW